MGTHTKRRLALGTLVILAVAVISAAGFAALPNRPAYAPNEVLITIAPGRSEADVAGVASKYGLTIAARPTYGHTYVLKIPGSGTPVDSFLGNKDSILRTFSGVQHVSRNYYYYPSATPNDEYYPVAQSIALPQFFFDPDFTLFGQWQFRPNMHVFAPEGWDLQKGNSEVTVAVIDTGVRTFPRWDDSGKLVRIVHPDLQGRVVSGIDFGDLEDIDGDPSPSEDPKVGMFTASHGTHVAGIIAAQGDNWIGISGLCWDGVNILPIKVFPDDGYGAPTSSVIEGIWYAMFEKVDVINMSLGRIGFSDSLEESIINQAARQGIIVVCSAGNDWEYGAYSPGYPAAYPSVICVGATQWDNVATDFSQRGPAMDIVAPGDGILSTVFYRAYTSVDNETDPINPPAVYAPRATAWPQPSPWPTWPDKYGNSYDFWPGTSMAAPHVAAAAALLLSHGVSPADVKPLLYETATPIGIGRPNETHGWGLLNVYGALKKATIDVEIQSPSKGSVVKTSRPRFRVNLRHAKLDTIRVWIDGVDTTGDGIPDNQPTLGGPNPEIANWQNYLYTLDAAAGEQYLLFEYAVNPNNAVNGLHSVYATAETDMTLSVPPPPPSDTCTFKVDPQTMGSGWRLFSVPFYFSEPKKPEETMGDVGLLARWHYTNGTTGEYALYSLDGSRCDDEASFTPISAYANSIVQPMGFTQGTPPAGLGYWLYLSAGSDVAIPDGYGDSMDQWPYMISLYSGWNIVGNPYAFAVDWSNVQVEYAGERLTSQEAVARGWISSAIFRYDSVYRRYTWKDVSKAVMVPWEAQWVRVKVRTPELTPSTIAAWSDDFSDGVIDQDDPEPRWFVGNTSGSVLESGGMLRLAGISGLPSYTYVADKDFPIYSDFNVEARLVLADSQPTVSGGVANAELRFRASNVGIGYSLAFNAEDVPSNISLRRSDSGQIIQSKQVVRPLASGSAFYVTITAVGSHIKVKVGTFPGRGDVADWELEDSTFTGPGSFWLINDGMLDCRWDYFRYSPVTIRPADVKLIVAPNPYTGAVQ